MSTAKLPVFLTTTADQERRLVSRTTHSRASSYTAPYPPARVDGAGGKLEGGLPQGEAAAVCHGPPTAAPGDNHSTAHHRSGEDTSKPSCRHSTSYPPVPLPPRPAGARGGRRGDKQEWPLIQVSLDCFTTTCHRDEAKER
jgi:hypothetical protein